MDRGASWVHVVVQSLHDWVTKLVCDVGVIVNIEAAASVIKEISLGYKTLKKCRHTLT